MRVFKDVDVISALRRIMENNTVFYQTDFKYDADTLKEAAKGSRFYWMSRTSGTWLCDERDTHVRDAEGYNTWQYYSDTKYYGVKAFVIDVTDNDDGRPFGDIYELHYGKHKEEVRQNSFDTSTVDVTFKPNSWQERVTREIDVAEYNNNWRAILIRYGEPESIRHNLSQADEIHLAEILAAARLKRGEEAVPTSVGSYIKEMVKERFHEYGYTRDDMAFITPEDAIAALKHLIPVYILHPDNTAKPAKTKVDIDNAVYDRRMLGIGGKDKKLLKFFKAGNTLADLPFSHLELSTIFHMALDRGKENIENEQWRKAIDGIIHVLDTILFTDDGRDAADIELDEELDEGEDMEP
jgi:hypothetical protein